MANTPSILDAVMVAVRLPGADVGWIKAQAKPLGGNFSLVVRQLITDARSFYGLPDPLRDSLLVEAERLGKTPRDYIVHVLAERALALSPGRPTKTIRK